VDVDVAVIGGGIADAAAAWAIAPDASVAVLEAESAVGFHSTGRSAAILTQSYESGPIRALTARTRRILGEEFGELTGVLSDRGVLWVATRAEQAALEAAAETALRGPAEVRRIDAGEARRLCPASRAGACAGALFEPEAKAIDVDLLHQEMLRRARADGCAVLLDAGVDALERQPVGWAIRFGGSELRACAPVNAAGAWADHIAALAGVAPVRLSPLRRTVFLFDPPPGSGHQPWPFTIGIAKAWYFGPHGPVMLGSNGDEHPDVPRDVRAQDIDVAEAIEKFNAATTCPPPVQRGAGPVGVQPEEVERAGHIHVVEAGSGQAAVASVAGGLVHGALDAGPAGVVRLERDRLLRGAGGGLGFGQVARRQGEPAPFPGGTQGRAGPATGGGEVHHDGVVASLSARRPGRRGVSLRAGDGAVVVVDSEVGAGVALARAGLGGGTGQQRADQRDARAARAVTTSAALRYPESR